jgi:putative membrane protein
MKLWSATVVFAQVRDADDHMDWGDGWGLVMMLGMLTFWVLIALAVVWLVRHYISEQRPRRDTPATALELLDRRLAEGAISIEEYGERRRALTEAARRPDAPTSS